MSEMPRVFTATAEIVLPSPKSTMQALCARFREFGEVSGRGRCRRIETGFGAADVEDCGKCLKICAFGKDEVALAYVKLAMAEHLLNLAETAPTIVWYGDGAAGAPLPYFREMRVKRIADVTPHMRRLTLTGENLGRFAEGGLHVRLLLPKFGSEPQWPVMGDDGRPKWPEGDARPDVRIYTLRRVDPDAGEVDIDFVLHEHDTEKLQTFRTDIMRQSKPGGSMPGATFGAEAKIGDVVGMTGPGGGKVPEADWYLLLGDETAIPAIARILERLPATATAIVRIEVENEAERQVLPSLAKVDLQWLYRGNRTLSDTLGEIEWPDDGRSIFAWAGCEFRDFVTIRKHFRGERGLTREQHLAVAYWRKGFAGDEARKDAR